MLIPIHGSMKRLPLSKNSLKMEYITTLWNLIYANPNFILKRHDHIKEKGFNLFNLHHFVLHIAYAMTRSRLKLAIMEHCNNYMGDKEIVGCVFVKC